MNVTFINDGIHDTIGNISAETIVVTYGLTLSVVVKTPATTSDLSYQRVWLSTTVNVEKFSKGNRGNFITAMLMEQVFKSLDFELKFPMPKVGLTLKLHDFQKNFIVISAVSLRVQFRLSI